MPGVAVAVALVPPLGTIGVTLKLERFDLARGATLLFTTNLVAIVLSGLVVFVTTGFVPVRHLQRSRRRVGAIAVGVAAATTAIAFPLTITSVHAAEDAQRTSDVTRSVLAWLNGTGLDLLDVHRSGHDVTVDIAGPGEPPPTTELSDSLAAVLGLDTTVRVRWDQRTESSGDDGASTPEPADQIEAVRRAVASWLRDENVEPDLFDVIDVQLGDDSVVIDLAGPSPPPSAASLATALDVELHTKRSVKVRWTQRQDVPNAPTTTQPEDSPIATARNVVTAWANTHPDLRVGAVNLNTSGPAPILTIDLTGSEAPTDVAQLRADLQGDLGDDTQITIFFTEQIRLVPGPTPTTTSPTRPSTSTSANPTSQSATTTPTVARATTAAPSASSVTT